MTITSPRALAQGFPTVPPYRAGSDIEKWTQNVREVIANIMDGKISATGNVTLTASATSTTISDRRIGPNSCVLLSPTTANAAAALGTTYITAGDMAATVTHANNAQIDRTYRYAVLG